jgi:hypothetical protein
MSKIIFTGEIYLCNTFLQKLFCFLALSVYIFISISLKKKNYNNRHLVLCHDALHSRNIPFGCAIAPRVRASISRYDLLYGLRVISGTLVQLLDTVFRTVRRTHASSTPCRMHSGRFQCHNHIRRRVWQATDRRVARKVLQRRAQFFFLFFTAYTLLPLFASDILFIFKAVNGNKLENKILFGSFYLNIIFKKLYFSWGCGDLRGNCS